MNEQGLFGNQQKFGVMGTGDQVMKGGIEKDEVGEVDQVGM